MKNVYTFFVVSCVIVLSAVFVSISVLGADAVRGYCEYASPKPVPVDFWRYIGASAVHYTGGTYPDDSIVIDSESNYDVALEADENQEKQVTIMTTYINGVFSDIQEEITYGRKACSMVTCR